MHDYDDDFLYKNVILLTTCIFYWHIWWRWGWRPPLQGRRKKNLRGGGEVLFVSAPFRSVIFYRPPPKKYIVRFNPPLFQSRRGGGNIRCLYLPPSFLRPCFLEKPRFLPKIFLRNHWFYMILCNIGLGGGIRSLQSLSYWNVIILLVNNKCRHLHFCFWYVEIEWSGQVEFRTWLVWRKVIIWWIRIL